MPDYEMIAEAAVFGKLDPGYLARAGARLKPGKTWEDLATAVTIEAGDNIANAGFARMTAVIENKIKEVIEPIPA